MYIGWQASDSESKSKCTWERVTVADDKASWRFVLEQVDRWFKHNNQHWDHLIANSETLRIGLPGIKPTTSKGIIVYHNFNVFLKSRGEI